MANQKQDQPAQTQPAGPAGPTSPLTRPPSIFAGTGESGYTYEQEQAARAWHDADDRNRPAALARLEALIDNPDREIEIMQWARAQAEKAQRPDAGVPQGPNPDAGDRPRPEPGPGRGTGRP